MGRLDVGFGHDRDLLGRRRAIAREVLRARAIYLPRNRPRDLARHGSVFLLDAVGAVVTGAALDGVHFGARDELQHLARFEADVLYAQMARHLVADLAEAHREIRLQLAGA